MTRITERSPAYPDGVRRTKVIRQTKFGFNGNPWPEDDSPTIIPLGGSLELAYEPDGGAGASDLDTGDDARDHGPEMKPAFERDFFSQFCW